MERKGLKENAEYMGAFYQPLIAGKMPKTRLATDWRINCTEMEEGQIKVSISYRFLCEVPFFQGWRFPIRQEFCFLPYIGVYDPDQYEEQEEKKEDIVYVTKNGTVYHESKNCTYLRMNVRRVSGEKLEKERNFSGGKYEACLSCRGKEGQYFYVTDYGTKYHTSLQCSSICRDIKEISREAAANMKRCSKCGKKNEKQN